MWIVDLDKALGLNSKHKSNFYICLFFYQASCCSECDSSGPNLWLCLHRGCYKVGCGEAHNDHSTLHNRVRTLNVFFLCLYCLVNIQQSVEIVINLTNSELMFHMKLQTKVTKV